MTYVFFVLHIQSDKKASNPMRDIRVSKLVLNCCVGESGDKLQKAAKVRNMSRIIVYVVQHLLGMDCDLPGL